LNMDIFKNQMNKWLATIPNYIKQCLNISVCESWVNYLWVHEQ